MTDFNPTEIETIERTLTFRRTLDAPSENVSQSITDYRPTVVGGRSS
ncbi:hypothetical protein [Haladaptatus halobius]|nr:hypothetical protein [Haladaptatus halobius]